MYKYENILRFIGAPIVAIFKTEDIITVYGYA